MSSRPDLTATLLRTSAVGIGGIPRAMIVALGVPLLVVLLGIAPYLAMPLLDGNDRAIVWITGSDAALQAAIARTRGDDAFDGAAREDVDVVPSGCPADAVRLHFDIQRVDEAQLARALLESIAATAGATVCASNHFELDRSEDIGTWLPLAASLVLPIGLLVAVFAAVPIPRETRGRVASGFSGYALLFAALATLLSPLPGGASLGEPAAMPLLLMVLLTPAIHEVAFRGWLIARLAPCIGELRAVGISVLASVLAAAPFAEPADLGQATLVAIACGAIHLRTRSLPACIATHLLLTAAGRALATMS